VAEHLLKLEPRFVAAGAPVRAGSVFQAKRVGTAENRWRSTLGRWVWIKCKAPIYPQ
jgi:hypothetical protein